MCAASWTAFEGRSLLTVVTVKQENLLNAEFILQSFSDISALNDLLHCRHDALGKVFYRIFNPPHTIGANLHFRAHFECR